MSGAWKGLLALALVGSAGCYTHNLSLNGAGVPGREPDHKRWHHHMVAGLVNLSNDWKPNELCPTDAAFIRVERGVVPSIVGTLTVAIYTPTVEKVWCELGSVNEDPDATGSPRQSP